MGALFLLFTAVPLLELYLLVRVGSVLGALNTLLLVIVTGALGASLARREFRSVMDQWRRAMESGVAPEDGMLSGALVFVGGLMLVTPGILTDLLGLWLLLPFSRRAAARVLRRALEQQIAQGRVQVSGFGNGSAGPFGGPHGPFESGPGPTRGPRAPRTPRGPIQGGVIDTDGEDVSDR